MRDDQPDAPGDRTVLPFDITESVDGNLVASVDDVRSCFRLLLNREPSVGEWPGHSSHVGSPLEPLVRNYLSSLEFRRRSLLVSDDRLTEISIEGQRLYVYADDTGPSAMMLNGSYEPDVTKIVRDHLDQNSVFLDIGANIGYYSMIAANIARLGRVIAVEPSVRNVRALRSSAILNEYSNVEIIQSAATATWQLLAFGSTGSNGSIGDLSDDSVSVDIVQGIPLDAPLASLNRLDLIKIDVEGAELTALTGLRETLTRLHPTIVSEFSPPALLAVSHGSAQDYLSLLFDLGYDVAQILSDGSLSQPSRSAGQVVGWFEDASSDHIDILGRWSSQ